MGQVELKRNSTCREFKAVCKDGLFAWQGNQMTLTPRRTCRGTFRKGFQQWSFIQTAYEKRLADKAFFCYTKQGR